MGSAIHVEDLTFIYEEEPVLENLSLEVKKGEFLGMIGPNGGGKTTLFKLLMGLLKPKQGEILIEGKKPKEARDHIGYVPQVFAYDKIFPLSTLDLVLQGSLSKLNWYGTYPKAEKEKAAQLLERVGLKEFVKAPFGSLSGGQAQRALIARALLSDPDILLLDEPTANVDSHAEKVIYDLLRELKGKKTLLMITHDLTAVVNEVDRVYCVQRKGIALTREEVCQHYAIGVYHPPHQLKGKQ